MTISNELAAKLRRMDDAHLRAAMRLGDQLAEEIAANPDVSAEVKAAAFKLAAAVIVAGTNIIKQRMN